MTIRSVVAGLVTGYLLLFNGCSKSELGLNEYLLTHSIAIAFTSELEIIDYVLIPNDAGFTEIDFLAPDTGEEVCAMVLGANRHEYISDKHYVSSRKAEGFKGRVSVTVQKGLVTSIGGNSIRPKVNLAVIMSARLAAYPVSLTGHKRHARTRIYYEKEDRLSSLSN